MYAISDQIQWPDFMVTRSDWISTCNFSCSVLISEPHPSCCCFSPHKASLVFAGSVSYCMYLTNLHYACITHTHTRTHARTHARTHPRTYVHACTHTHILMHIYMQMNTLPTILHFHSHIFPTGWWLRSIVGSPRTSVHAHTPIVAAVSKIQLDTSSANLHHSRIVILP